MVENTREYAPSFTVDAATGKTGKELFDEGKLVLLGRDNYFGAAPGWVWLKEIENVGGEGFKVNSIEITNSGNSFAPSDGITLNGDNITFTTNEEGGITNLDYDSTILYDKKYKLKINTEKGSDFKYNIDWIDVGSVSVKKFETIVSIKGV